MPEYIAEYGTVAESELAAICAKIKAQYMLLMYTHGMVRCVESGNITDAEHLLEARLFNSTQEIRILRPVLGKEFTWRLIDDDKFKLCCDGSSFDSIYENCVFTEEHLLDIDRKADNTDGFTYTATGGGMYILPVKNAKKVKLCDYITYDSNGIASITDFRIVGFEEG